jgi:phosphoribosylpyrophosphate synthetase
MRARLKPIKLKHFPDGESLVTICPSADKDVVVIDIDQNVTRARAPVVTKGQPLYEIHASTDAQLGFARAYVDAHADIFKLGF